MSSYKYPCCNRGDDFVKSVRCDKCKEWYHFICVGVDDSVAEVFWYCKPCLQDDRSLQYSFGKPSNTASSSSYNYSTELTPLEKEAKDKKLSANIQKFLAKREEENRQKALEEKRKRDELMAKREAKKKIEKMLKLMDKYKNTLEEKFKDGTNRVMTKEDKERAKARVKDALIKVKEEENALSTRKRKDGGECTTREEESASGSSKKGSDRYDPEEERRKEAEEEAAKKKARRPTGPAPPDFATLLKLAEQKQCEPVKIDVPVIDKKKEPERLMTKEEKKEYEEHQAYLEQKKIRDRIRNDSRLSEKERQNKLAQYDAMKAGKISPAASASKSGPSSTNVMTPNWRIPKLNSSTNGSDRPSTAPSKPPSASYSSRPSSSSRPDEKRSSL